MFWKQRKRIPGKYSIILEREVWVVEESIS